MDSFWLTSSFYQTKIFEIERQGDTIIIIIIIIIDEMVITAININHQLVIIVRRSFTHRAEVVEGERLGDIVDDRLNCDPLRKE